MSRRSLTLALVTVLTLSASVASAQKLDPGQVNWTKITMRASKLGISTTADVTLRSVPVAQAEGDLLKPIDHEGLMPDGDPYALVLASAFMGRESDSTVYFDPTSGKTYQRLQTEVGKRNRLKINRFTENGVFTLRKNPNDGEEDKGFDAWTNVRETFYPHPNDYPIVIEPGVLFYIASAADLDESGETMEAVFFSRDEVAVADIKVDGMTEIKVDYQKDGQRVKGKVPVIHMSVRPKPIPGVTGELELIGLEGDIDIYVDPETRIPLQMSGRVKIAGKVDIKLQSVSTK